MELPNEDGKNDNRKVRKTLTAIPLPKTLAPTSKAVSKGLQKTCLKSKGDSSSISNIVFQDSTRSVNSNGISEGVRSVAYVVGHQIVQISRDVKAAAMMNVAKARQDARVHIFTAALLEHICHIYEPNPYKRKRVLQELCSKLTERDMLSPIAFLDIFSLWREKYITGFGDLMRSTIELVEKDSTLTASLPATNMPMSDQLQLSLITKPSISMLMRDPSDPRSSFLSSRYSNDFREIKSIGSGGFGSVFKVRNTLDEMLYAIKKVRLKRLNHAKCRKLLREVKVLATLNHPSIVRYNSAWLEQEAEAKVTELSKDSLDGSSSEDREPTDNDQNHTAPFEAQRIVLYIQMELCHGNLHNWLTKRNKSLFSAHSHTDVYGHVHESENLHFIRQLLNGLDYVHTQGIIHRDIKTRNIFIGAHGALKIGDFGLARDVVASPSPTLAKEPDWDSDPIFYDVAGVVGDNDLLSKGIGTSVYSSPEQQSERTYDSKTDIYSAGIIVFELYCPFSTEMERYEKIKHLRKRKAIPDELLTRWVEQMNMVTKMVDLNPAVRPSAKDLLSSDLYLDKDQIISHLESRVEKLESENESLRRENQMLQESVKVETSDYAMFLKWKREVVKPVGGV